MTDSLLRVFFILLYLTLTHTIHHNVHYGYCIIGAGPGGLQTAYFLHKSARNYMVFERDTQAGAFYKKYPRHRRLISINKRYTGKTNKEFNLRHDWNSLVSDDEELRMTRYTKDFFPHADVLVKYLNDFASKLQLNVSYNVNILNVAKDKTKDIFILKDQKDNIHTCGDLIVSTGMSTEIKINFKGSEYVEHYGSMSLNPNDYEGQSVLILGRGNSAFETADHIIGSTNLIHMFGRSRVRLAWATHYVGDLRAINNGLLDTYQLKSLDGLIEAPVNDITIVKHNEKYYINAFEGNESSTEAPDNFAVRDPYDRVLGCLGFQFDYSIFDESAKPKKCDGKRKKFPSIKDNYESTEVPRMWFSGVVTHSLDWRKSAGGFIHGYRYTARALTRVLEWKNHKVKWFHHKIPQTEVLNFIIKRINEASATYQMFGVLTDVIIYLDDDKALYVEEFPVKLLTQFHEMTGLPTGPMLVINLEYGSGFSGPGKDPFHESRATGEPSDAHNSNFLHPVIYFYKQPPRDLLSNKLPKPDRIHHIVEDFLTLWTAPSSHLLPLRRFIETTRGQDMRNFFAESCFKLGMTRSTLPVTCEKHYMQNSGITISPYLSQITKNQELLI